jgi:hypothetical protein
MKFSKVLEMQVLEQPFNRVGMPGPGYAAAGFQFHPPDGEGSSIKQSYMAFGKNAPTSAQRQGMSRKCPHCGAPVSKQAKLCSKCKKDLEETPEPPTEDRAQSSSP